MHEESMIFITHTLKGSMVVGNTSMDEDLEFSKICVVLNYKVLFINKTI